MNMTVLMEQPMSETTRPQRHDAYVHHKVTEASDPDMVRRSLQIHAEGYYDNGFVDADAILPDGTMVLALDKSRGPYTDYYLAINPDSTKRDEATMRKRHLPLGSTFRDLPTYEMCAPHLYPEGRQYLQDIQGQDMRLKEIGGMARRREASPVGIFEIIRSTIQEAAETDEVWFFSIVSTTLGSLQKSFGTTNFHIIGEGVDIGDTRVNNDKVSLIPTIVTPSEFIGNILADYSRSENAAERRILQRSFLFLADGMPQGAMSQEVRDAQAEFTLGKAAVRSTVR
jgi:hypothetical protein